MKKKRKLPFSEGMTAWARARGNGGLPPLERRASGRHRPRAVVYTLLPRLRVGLVVVEPIVAAVRLTLPVDPICKRHGIRWIYAGHVQVVVRAQWLIMRVLVVPEIASTVEHAGDINDKMRQLYRFDD
jgi:hypothetical protein